MRRNIFLLMSVALITCLLPSCDFFDDLFGGGDEDGTITISGSIAIDNTVPQPAGNPSIIVGLMSYVPPESTSISPTWASGVADNPQSKPYGATTFSFTGVPAGGYIIVAWVDLNGDRIWQEGEASGMYPNGATAPYSFNDDFSGANITLSATGGGGGTSVTIGGTVSLASGVTLTSGTKVVVGLMDALPGTGVTTPDWYATPASLTWGGTSVSYSFSSIPAGNYVVIAWADLDNDNAWETGEASGTYPDWGSSGSLYNFTASKSDANITLYAGTAVGGFPFPEVSNVWKGVLLTNPDTPANMAYVYIENTNRSLVMKTSTDSGTTWGSPTNLESSAKVTDFAAAMDSSSSIVVEYVRGASDDSGTGGVSYWIKATMAGVKNDPTMVWYNMSPGRSRLPSVFRASGSCIYFGIGLDTGTGGNDTTAYSIYWNGSYMTTEAVNVWLNSETDNPYYIQQIYGETSGTIAYLYYDNHYDWSSGDAFLISGTSYTSWAGEYPGPVANALTGFDATHAMLFKAGSEYILVYAVKNSDYSSHVARMSHASPMYGLNTTMPPVPADVQISGTGTNLAQLSDTTGSYHVMYAAQDPTSGAVYVAWQKADSGIEWVSINPTTFAVSTPAAAATGLIDGVSALAGKLYISYRSASNVADVVEVTP